MTFAWLEDMSPGSFAGVSVRYPSMSVERGRHVVLTEIPGGDKGHFADLGLRVKKWQVEFIVIGDDYHIAAQELEEKLDNERGPWPMVDPWRGESQVEIISPVTVAHSTESGGLARFRFSAALADPLEFPVLSSPVAAVSDAVGPAVLTARDEFASRFSIGKLSQIVRSALGRVTGELRKVNGRIASSLAVFDDLSNQIDAWEAEVTRTNVVSSALFGALQSVWDGASDLVLSLASGPDLDVGLNDGGGRGAGYHEPVAIVGEVLDAIKSADLGADDIDPSVAESADGKAAKAAVVVAEFAYKVNATAYMLAALVDLEIPSVEQAEAMQVQIVELFSDLLTYEMDGPTTEALADLRASTIDWIVTSETQVPSSTRLRVAKPVPATVLAKRVYGDSRRHADILRRNAVHVPARVQGDIEVDRG